LACMASKEKGATTIFSPWSNRRSLAVGRMVTLLA
jgi:hypothetical protein